MDEQSHITVQSFCMVYQADPDFVHSLQESGLIHITREDDQEFISLDDMADLERFLRLHHELGIHAGDIDVVSHLLRKISTLQQENQSLKNRLTIYE
jgi:hypothetical protein